MASAGGALAARRRGGRDRSDHRRRDAGAPHEPPPLVVTYKDQRWEIAQVEERHRRAPGRARARGGPSDAYAALFGAVWMPAQSPMMRVADDQRAEQRRRSDPAPSPTSMRPARCTARPRRPRCPASACSARRSRRSATSRSRSGSTRSIKRDYIAAYAANALLMLRLPAARGAARRSGRRRDRPR